MTERPEGAATGAYAALHSVGLSLDDLGRAADVGWISDCIRGQRHQAQLVYPGLDRDQLPGLFLRGKREDSHSSGPEIPILKDVNAQHTKVQ
jgi:hypothetical protein